MDNPADAEQYRICVIFGMAAFFASVARLPLCGTLVSVEMVAYASLGDRDTNLCFPILFCCMISYVTAVCFSPHTLFEILLKQDGISEHDIQQGIDSPVHANPFPRASLTTYDGSSTPPSRQLSQESKETPLRQESP